MASSFSNSLIETQFVGDLGDAVETGVERQLPRNGSWPGCRGRCRWVTGDTAVALDQAGETWCPVGRVDVRELGDAGDLVSSRCCQKRND